MNVLLSCAGRRNYLVKYFKKALGDSGKVIATDMQRNAPSLVDADIAIQVSSVDAPDYVDQLIEICKEQDIRLMLSLNDLELPVLSLQKHRFANIGVNLIVSDFQIIDICFDKWKTFLFLKNAGLNTPQTFIHLEEVLMAIDNGDLLFPLVIKPRWGSGSIGIDYPKSREELIMSYRLLSLRLQDSILANTGKEDINHAILIQEKLKGQEFGMDVLNDFKGNFVKAFPKKKLAMRAGETDKSVSVDNAALLEIGKTLGDHLKHIGNLDCDIFQTEKGYFVLELNPRFGGGYPFTYESGADFASVFIEWTKGGKDIDQLLKFRTGEAYSKYDQLMRVPTLDV